MADRRKSLRQLAKELGVSASYISQVTHGKRPASGKLLRKVLSNSERGVLSKVLSISPTPSVVRQNLIGYNQTTRGSAFHTLPSGVVAAQGNLDPLAQVRILARQPSPPPTQPQHCRRNEHYPQPRTRQSPDQCHPRPSCADRPCQRRRRGIQSGLSD
jgi:transcriptional regulator with XRE-family HTH domain